MAEKAKKPFYKKWWVWGIVLLIVIIGISTGDNEESDTTVAGTSDEQEMETETVVDEQGNTAEEVDGSAADETDELEESTEPVVEEETNDGATIESGTYIVGEEIPAGEYLVFSNGMAYIESSSDSTGSLESIIFNDNLMGDAHSYVTVKDGEYFKLQGGYMYPVNEAPSVIPEDGVYEDGMYKVGQDIPAGEYKVLLNHNAAAGMGYLEVSSDSSHQLGSIVTNELAQADMYITVSEGQYLKLQDLTIETE
ncbi:hypothetical protein [Oceanobacillus saliphilus]|uniref:hypothetical protein n=1 Tax=Oceanobacillus saliphilus TaxID=2925834 RepID=UPI00201E2830|nr:hypothetical protein [Oceanobacillus saliphilus]